MKIFISHKKEDEYTAFGIQQVLENMGIQAYLDILDDTISDNGEKLTKHIRKKLRECSDVIVVLSDNTKRSWWVPFEIGMSAQVDMPTASFLKSDVVLPSYLSYWPRLKTTTDVDKYVAVRKRVEQQMKQRCDSYTQANRRAAETRAFYEALKIELR